MLQSQKTGYLVHELLNEELPFEVEEEVFIKHQITININNFNLSQIHIVLIYSLISWHFIILVIGQFKSTICLRSN